MTMSEVDIRVLQKQVTQVICWGADRSPVEAAIRHGIRSARNSPDTAKRLRLVLGELLHSLEPGNARAQYRKILDEDPRCVEAMIGMGDTFCATGRRGIAERWYLEACRVAKENVDQPGRMESLSSLAFNALYRGDTVTVSDALTTMCAILSTAPRMDSLNTVTAHELIRRGKGEMALPYVKCLMRHMLSRGCRRGLQFQVLICFVEIQRRAGHTRQEVSDMLQEYRPLAANEELAAIFDSATERALERSHLHFGRILGDE